MHCAPNLGLNSPSSDSNEGDSNRRTVPSSSSAGILDLSKHPSSSSLIVSYPGSVMATARAEASMNAVAEKNKKKEHKKRSKNWTRAETLKLIELRTELDPRFLKGGVRKSELWDEISEALQREKMARDSQQCKDKWEKLTAAYKEVCGGVRDKEDNPYYEELHQVLSGRAPQSRNSAVARDKEEEEEEEEEEDEETSMKKEKNVMKNDNPFASYEDSIRACRNRDDALVRDIEVDSAVEELDEDTRDGNSDSNPTAMTLSKKKKKKKRKSEALSAAEVLESISSQQQEFFRGLLEAMERKEQMRERIREEREEKWRAEERTQRTLFNNAMLLLTQKLLGERLVVVNPPPPPPPPPPVVAPVVAPIVSPVFASAVAPGGESAPPKDPAQHHSQSSKKRSKNWRRSEVMLLIKLRSEMDTKFVKSTRRAGLWEELAEKLVGQGVHRDGKQCREKWDKLMAEYKDVIDGRRDRAESPYFAELAAFVGRPVELGLLSSLPEKSVDTVPSK